MEYREIEIPDPRFAVPADTATAPKASAPQSDDRYLWTQMFVCLFLFGICFFAYRQGGTLWKNLSQEIQAVMQNGLSFSGRENLTRLTDEITDFWGRVVQTSAGL